MQLLTSFSLAQAKTGTGKTIGFLLPVIQRILEASVERPLYVPTRNRRLNPRNAEGRTDIRAIVISPTRELAEQIYKDAVRLTHKTSIRVQLAVGGTRKQEALMKTWNEGCHLLVATPGRLNDLLTDPQAHITAPNCQMLVLDEADNLLDQGFSDAIQDISKMLPKQRQTLAFSATVPQRVMAVMRRTLKPGFKFARMVDPNEEPTHARIPQHLITVRSFENLFPALLETCLKEIAHHNANPELGPFKAIVFFPTVKVAIMAHEVFRRIPSRPHPLYPTKMIEIHSGLTQSQRTRAAEHFRQAESAVLFSSDVTARGMDFPGVTHVIQIGAPKNAEQYVHRLGRTGRAGKDGKGFLIISELEMKYAAQELHGLPIKKHGGSSTAQLDLSKEAELPKSTVDILTHLSGGYQASDPALFKDTYRAMIGYYGHVREKGKLIESLNSWALHGAGYEVPAVSSMLVEKMGLRGVPGLVVGAKSFSGLPSAGDRGRGFGDRSRSSGGGFGGRSQSSGGFERRSFGNRDRDGGDREGGFRSRSFEGGDMERGFRPRSFDGGDRQGGFRSRSADGGFARRSFGDRDGGDRRSSEGYQDRPRRSSGPQESAPWMGRGRQGRR